MIFKDLAKMFNSAVAAVFNLKKFLFLFLVLILSGLLYLFFQGVSAYITNWMQVPVRYLPLFFIISLILAAGALLGKLYHKERQGEKPLFRKVLWDSWELLVKSTYLAIPLLLAFLLFWVLLGIFIFLKAIPLIGIFFGVILAFGPFLINLGVIVLFLAALFLFFFVTPAFALNQGLDRKALLQRIRFDFFTNLLLLLVALFPVWIIGKIVGKAAFLTLEIYSFRENAVMTTFQLFFVMLPMMAVMTPPINFFFNFALESLLWAQKNGLPQENVSDLESK